MKSWTTTEQLLWLEGRVSDWQKSRQCNQVAVFLAETVTKFSKKFSVPESEQSTVNARVRKWYYNHVKPSRNSNAAPVNVDFTKTQRKVVPLPPAQAYSILYCTPDSDLYDHLHGEWKRYVSADETTVNKYKHLFPAQHNPKLPFVAFQQAYFRDKIPLITEDERNIIDAFIESRFQEETELRERPWRTLKLDESQSDVDLQRQYTKDQIISLTPMFDNVCANVKKATNFNTLVLTGGPNALGSGAIQLFQISCGETVLAGETFDQFLGPLWDTLKQKYWEWLRKCYTREEIYRADNVPSGGPAPPVVSQGSGLTSSAPDATGGTPLTDIPTLVPIPPDERDATTPPTPSCTAANNNASDVPASDSPDSPANNSSGGPSNNPSGGSSDNVPENAPPPSRTPPSVPRRTSSPSPSTLSPSWTLGPQHRKYVHDAASYLADVPGGPEWEKLLERYITFESLCGSGTSQMPKKPRPEELSWWFRIGRRQFTKKGLPTIKSVQEFEQKWIQWWSAAQPHWRVTQDWPFEKGDVAGEDWGDLLEGGKDGIYLFIVSLAWWIHARDPAEESRVDEAIGDVSWVLQNLLYRLSAAAPRKRRPDAIETDRPAKQARLRG